ncbi:UbiH 2-polyprenyl-6-methoxyphenol hydroxylase and related FAD-dependent oxidoreductases [Candidatus Pelagibacterales bacterium]
MFKKIIIVGAGIAGLTLANFLKKNNFNNFRVYERFEKKLTRPTGIQLTPNAVRILDFLDSRFFLNNNFNRINYLNINAVNSKNFNDKSDLRINLQNIVSDKMPYLTCDRNILMKFLEKNLSSKEIFYNRQVVQTIKDHNIIRVKFNDGSEDYCDLLVSADGMFSNSRLDNNIITNTNFYAYRGVLKNFYSKYSLENDVIRLWLSGNKHLVTYYISNQNDLSFTGISKSTQKTKLTNDHINYSISFPADEFRSLFSSENKILREMLDTIHEVYRWPIFSLKKRVFYRDNQIFIGDSSHGTVPFQAQGAALAIEDSYVLYEQIIKNITNNLGVFYFNKRNKRVRRIILRSHLNVFLFHLKNPFFRLLRSIIFKVIEKSFLAKKIMFGWIFNYNPRSTSYFF